eukprot:9768750-Heterocapsa_arctica.AAC.1
MKWTPWVMAARRPVEEERIMPAVPPVAAQEHARAQVQGPGPERRAQIEHERGGEWLPRRGGDDQLAASRVRPE